MKRFALALFALLSFAPSAQAQTPRLNHMRPIATAAFPAADARCGHVAIRLVDRRTYASPFRCEIGIERSLLAAPRLRLCATLVHEFGHIDLTTGRGAHDPRNHEDHSRNRGSIMFGGFLAEDRVPACNRIAWAEDKLAALRDHARRLRAHRRRAALRVRASVNRRLSSVKARARFLRWVVGP